IRGRKTGGIVNVMVTIARERRGFELRQFRAGRIRHRNLRVTSTRIEESCRAKSSEAGSLEESAPADFAFVHRATPFQSEASTSTFYFHLKRGRYWAPFSL